MPQKIEKADFSSQEALLSWCKPVYVRERSDDAVLTSGGAVKYVDACRSGREDRESSFHLCRSPVGLVQACLCAGKTG